jgi:hypothetical protein
MNAHEGSWWGHCKLLWGSCVPLMIRLSLCFGAAEAHSMHACMHVCMHAVWLHYSLCQGSLVTPLYLT